MNPGQSSTLKKTDRLALLVVDPQADFCTPNGVYARSGVDITPIRKILTPLQELMQACHDRQVPTIASQFTILTDRRGRPLVGPALIAVRPFLAEGGFRLGSPGHAVVEELPRPDFLIEKPTFSAFYASRLDYLLGRLGIEHLMICGVGTNGAVETTLRDAQLRDLELTLITDCTAGFRADLHEMSLKNMAGLAKQVSSSSVIESLKG